VKRLLRDKWFWLATLFVVGVLAFQSKAALGATDIQLQFILAKALEGLVEFFDFLITVLQNL